MNNNLLKNSFKRLFLFLLIFSFVATACNRKIAFETSTVVPAADGQVKLKRDDNKNYIIDLEVKNLAAPDRLTPPRNVYVVWIEDENNMTKNVGQLKSGSGLFTSGLKASLRAVSATKPRRVYITAEDSAEAQYIGSQVVLTTSSF
jgi:hypothetical protein